MTSVAQLEANRRNAQRSTGPRTLEGKSRSSQNATRHGLTSRLPVALLQGPFADNPDELKDFVNAVMAELAPATELERAEALHLAGCLVRRQRLVEIEALALAHGTDVPILPPVLPGGPTRVLEGDQRRAAAGALTAELFDRLPRYEAHLSKEIDRSTRRLEELKARRLEKQTDVDGEVVQEAKHLLSSQHYS